MDSNRSVRLTEDQIVHERVLREVLRQVQDTPYVLKGGSALSMTRNIARHSTDLDFDAPKRVNIQKRILEGLKQAGVAVLSVKVAKDTDTVQRFKAHYADPGDGVDRLLKVETNFREAPDPAKVETVNGINTYKLDAILDQKLDAIDGRTAPRDLYDVAFIVNSYPELVSEAQWERLDGLTADMEDIQARYYPAFEDDPVLDEANIADVIINLCSSIENRGAGLDHKPTIDAAVNQEVESPDPGVTDNVVTLQPSKPEPRPPELSDEELEEIVSRDFGVDLDPEVIADNNRITMAEDMGIRETGLQLVSDNTAEVPNPAAERFLIKKAELEAKEEFKRATDPTRKLAREIEAALVVANDPNVSPAQRAEALGRAQSASERMGNAWSQVENEQKADIIQRFDARTGQLSGETVSMKRVELTAAMSVPSAVRAAGNGVEDATLAAQARPGPDAQLDRDQKSELDTNFTPGPPKPGGL